MTVDYTLPKPTAGSSRATSPTESEIMGDISDTIADVDSRLDALESGAYPAHVHIPFSMPLHAENTGGAGGNGVVQLSTAYFGGFRRNANLQNTYYEWEVGLRAGTYTLTYVHVKAAARAIATFSISGTDVGTIDTYAASTTASIGELTGITIPASGLHLIRLTAATRNASATAWYMDTSAVDLFRTGD